MAIPGVDGPQNGRSQVMNVAERIIREAVGACVWVRTLVLFMFPTRASFVAEGDHGAYAAGAEGGDVACGAGDYGQPGCGEQHG